MNSQADMFAAREAIEVSDERAREHEMDCTPTPVVRQLFQYLYTDGGTHYPTAGDVFLDPSAGAGVFGMVCAELCKNFVRRIAVEPRCEEYGNLAQHYHETWRGTLLSGAAMLADIGPVDLVATNPPFSHAIEFVRRLLPCLSESGEMWLLQLDDFGQRSRAGRDLFASWETRPTDQLRITGTIGFRPDGKTDSRSYSWWGWRREDMCKHRGTWSTRNLPCLPAQDRKWKTTRPGEEWRHA